MAGFLKKLYEPKSMVKKKLHLGEFPDTKQGYKTAFSTAWAAIAETFLIALIGMADTAMVSAVSPEAIGAVGITNQPRYLVQALILALNIAVTSLCARRRGEQNQQGAKSVLKQGLVLSGIFSLILLMISVPLTTPMIRLMGARDALVPMATDYLLIIFLGLPLHSISLTISAALRGIGETRASMVINMTANIVNVIFNWLLITGKGPFPALGVKGAAIATVIGYGVAMLVAFAVILNRKSYLFIGEKDGWKLDRETLAPIYQISSGSFLEQLCLRAGFMLYGRLIARLDAVTPLALSTHQILLMVLNLSFCFGEGFGIASSSLVGQNLGAKRPDLSIMYGKICQRMAFLSSSVIFVVLTFWGRELIGLLSRNDAQIMSMGEDILVLMGLIIFVQSSQVVLMGSLRGAGDTRYTAIVSMISIMIIRPILGNILAFPLGLGLFGAWIALGFDQFLRYLLTHLRFSSGKWAKMELAGAKTQEQVA